VFVQHRVGIFSSLLALFLISSPTCTQPSTNKYIDIWKKHIYLYKGNRVLFKILLAGIHSYDGRALRSDRARRRDNDSKETRGYVTDRPICGELISHLIEKCYMRVRCTRLLITDVHNRLNRTRERVTRTSVSQWSDTVINIIM
jgi:hypothetical protein